MPFYNSTQTVHMNIKQVELTYILHYSSCKTKIWYLWYTT